MAMDPKVKTKWLAALRSGTYEQGHGVLRTRDNKFCCLGVLCDILNPSKWRMVTAPISTRDFWVYESAYAGSMPDDNFLLSVGLCEGEELSPIELAEMNDSGKTFLEIADRIEREL